MQNERTVFAYRIIDYFNEKGIDCSVVDEHLSLLVTLYGDEATHEFRYGRRLAAGRDGWRRVCRVLEREAGRLKPAQAEREPRREPAAQAAAEEPQD